MSTVDVNNVIVTGENSVIRLNNNDNDAFTTHASFWRILTSPAGPGDVLYLKSELTEHHWQIYSNNIAMARWLQSTVVGAINVELLDPAIPVADAQFSKSGNARDFWTERLDARDERIALTWYQLGEPFLVHTQPKQRAGPSVWDVHSAHPGARCTTHSQWNRGGRPPLAERSRRSPLQHLRAGIMRKLDGGQIDDAGVVMSALTYNRRHTYCRELSARVGLVT
jgi:hypothetical protein